MQVAFKGEWATQGHDIPDEAPRKIALWQLQKQPIV